MNTSLLAIGVTATGSGAAVGLCALWMLAPETARRRVLSGLLAYSAGTLLAGALLVLLPESAALSTPLVAARTTLAGILLFFLLEKLVLWRHGHRETERAMPAPRGPLILVGDGLHNFVDGAVIAAAFLSSVPLGMATAVAVFSHEIPQEVGDFAILLDAGYSRSRALRANAVSACAAVAGAAAGLLLLEKLSGLLPHVMALSAGGFLYIAVADLIPVLRLQPSRRGALQTALILAGVATIAALEAIAP